MPPVHRRLRDKDSNQLGNSTAKDFETSNSTMMQFLGGAQKSWMTGNQGVNQIQTSSCPKGTLKSHLGRANAANQIRELPTFNQQETGKVPSGNRQESGHCQPPAETLLTPAFHPEAVLPLHRPVVKRAIASGTKSKSMETIPGIIHPFTALNDQAGHESAHIIDLEAETEENQQHQPSTINQGSAGDENQDIAGENNQALAREKVQDLAGEEEESLVGKEDRISRLNELADRYGGIEELEKRLRETKSPSRNESPKSSSAGTMPDPSHLTPRKRLQVEGGPSRKRVPPQQISIPGGSSQPSSTSVLTNLAPAVSDTNESIPSAATLKSLLAQISARRDQRAHGVHFEYDRRLTLLKDACNQADSSFLILHQLLCMGTTMAAGISYPLRLGAEHQSGLQLVTNCLLPINQLNADDLAWFATFPLPMELLLRNWPGLKKTYERVFSCLKKLPQAWPGVVNSCLNRCYPLLVDEMILLLGAHSTVLQLLISRHFFEKIWPDNEDDCFGEGYRLCIRNQQEVHSRVSSGNVDADRAEILSYNSAFAREYKSLWTKHQLHIIQRQHFEQITQQQGGRRASINTTMAPPQQIHSGIGLPMQDLVTNPHRIQRQDAQRRGSRAGSTSTPATPTQHNHSITGSVPGIDRPMVVPSSPLANTDFNSFTTGVSSTATYSPYMAPSFIQSNGFIQYPEVRTTQHGQTSGVSLSHNISEVPTAYPSNPFFQPARFAHTSSPALQHGQVSGLPFGFNGSENTMLSSPASFFQTAGSANPSQHGQASNMTLASNFSAASALQPSRSGPPSNLQTEQHIQTFDPRNATPTIQPQGDSWQMQTARSTLQARRQAPRPVQPFENGLIHSDLYAPLSSNGPQHGTNRALSAVLDPGPWNTSQNRGTLAAHTQSENPPRPTGNRPIFPARPSLQLQLPSQNPNGRPAETTTQQPILPPPGYVISLAVAPNPVLSALHQARVRSPIYASIDTSGKPDGKDAFAFVKKLAMGPILLNVNVKYFKWAFDVTKGDMDVVAQDVAASNHGPPTRTVRKGSRYFRLRCVKASGDEVLRESDFVIRKNVWPFGVAALLNTRALEFRKKAHHGEDLPVDATNYIKEGENILEIGTCQQQEPENPSYQVGLETIEITDSATIKEEIARIEAPEALARILKPTAVDPEELEVVGATIVLDLTDPHTSQLFTIPVRGKACRHNQCFDLNVFLQTRRRKYPKDPSAPDHFKCPICNADARPQSLAMDLYFVKLRAELEAMKRLDAKAVILGERGDWKIKEEAARRE